MSHDTPQPLANDAHPTGVFVHHHTARFYEIDRAGIVFFARVYEYCHAAFEELQTRAFGHPGAIFDSLGFGMPLVHSEADYTRPIRLGDRLEIALRVAKVGARSVTFAYTIVGEDDRAPRAKVTLVHAFIDMTSFKGIQTPPSFLEGLARVGLG